MMIVTDNVSSSWAEPEDHAHYHPLTYLDRVQLGQVKIG